MKPKMYFERSPKQMMAEEMSKQTGKEIHKDMITPIKTTNPYLAIYAAQLGRTTVMCWRRVDGKFVVKEVTW